MPASRANAAYPRAARPLLKYVVVKNPDRTTFLATGGALPRRAEADLDPVESSSGLYDNSGSHRFPTVPKLRRRLIPPVPAPYRKISSPGHRQDVTYDTLPRVSARTDGLPREGRKKTFLMLAVGVFLGFFTALFRLAHSR